MATKTKIPVTSENEDTERKMAVVKQRTGTRVEADIDNSSSTKSHLKIMIMNNAGGNQLVEKDKKGKKGKNQNGKKDKEKEKEKKEKNEKDKVEDNNRRKAINDVVTNTRAALVLFQEIRWKSIRSRGWKDHVWPENLHYTGHDEASILFDINEVTVGEYSQIFLEQTLSKLIRMNHIQQGFAPFSRMCLRKIKTKGVPIVTFICISWHGIHKTGLEEKKKQFKSILTYISKLSEKQSLPVILAGDFNVEIKTIETLVSPPLVLHKYTPTERRETNTIDFYISSESLAMSDIKPLTLTSETGVTEVLSLFDHDPVVAMMSTETENKDTAKTQSGSLPDLSAIDDSLLVSNVPQRIPNKVVITGKAVHMYRL